MKEMTNEELMARVDALRPKPTINEMDALKRLISIAKKDSGQCRFCANFLLAWWNAETCGGFDLTDMMAVDRTIADDMLTVCGMIPRLRSYPNDLGLKEDFHDIMRRWRPKLMAKVDSYTFNPDPYYSGYDPAH